MNGYFFLVGAAGISAIVAIYYGYQIWQRSKSDPEKVQNS